MTQETWDGLSPKGRWDIIVAQRGPDCRNSETLKWFTTAIVRAEMSKILRAWGGSAVMNGDLKAIILPNGRIGGGRTTDAFDYGHFLEHIHSAANFLELPVAHVESGIWKEAMDLGARTGNLWVVADKIITGIPEGYRDHPPFAELIRHATEYLKPKYRGWESITPELQAEVKATASGVNLKKSTVVKTGRRYQYVLETNELGQHNLKKVPIENKVANENL